MKLVIQHLECVERLDREDIEPRITIDKCRERVNSGRTLELVGRVEGDDVLGPPERTRCLELGEGRVHLTSKLLEDVIGGWGVSTS